jgi:hypothetical protein
MWIFLKIIELKMGVSMTFLENARSKLRVGVSQNETH